MFLFFIFFRVDYKHNRDYTVSIFLIKKYVLSILGCLIMEKEIIILNEDVICDSLS